MESYQLICKIHYKVHSHTEIRPQMIIVQFLDRQIQQQPGIPIVIPFY